MEQGNMKDYSFLKILSSSDKVLIHHVLGCRQSEEIKHLTLYSYYRRKIRSLIRSVIGDKISVLLLVHSQLV